MELTRLGVVIDPTGAEQGARRATAAADKMARDMASDLNKVEKESRDAGETVKRAGQQMENSARGVKQRFDQLGQSKGFAGITNGVRASLGDMRALIVNALDAIGLLDNRLGAIVRRGDSLLQTGAQARQMFGQTAAGATAASSAAGGFAAALGPVLAVVAAVVLALAGLVAGFYGVKKAIEFTTGAMREAAALEQYAVRLQVLTGSAEEARAKLKELNSFADDTPFTDAEVFNAGVKLEAMTKGALSTTEALKAIGGAAFTAGKEFSDVADLTGRLYNSLSLGMDFIEPLKTMASYGLVTGETVKKVIELGEQAKASGDKASMFAEQWAVVYADLLEKQDALVLASGTWEGKLSTLGGKWDALRAEFGQPILDALSPVLDQVLDLVKTATPLAAQLGQTVGAALQQIVFLFQLVKSYYQEDLQTIVDGLIGVFQNGAFMGLVSQALVDGFQAAMLKWLQLWANVYGVIITALEKAYIPLYNGFMKVAEDFINAILDGIQKMKDRILEAVKPLEKTGAVSGFEKLLRGAGTFGPEATPGTVDLGAYNAANSGPGPGSPRVSFPRIDENAVSETYQRQILDRLDRIDTFQETKQILGAGALATQFQRANQPADQLRATPIPGLQGLQGAEASGLRATPIDADKIRKSTEALKDQRSEMQRLMDDWADLGTQADRAMASLTQGLTRDVSAALTDAVMGTRSWKEAFEDLGQAVVAQIIQMVNQLWIQYTVQLLLNSVSGMFGGGGGIFGGAAVAHTGGGTAGAPVRSLGGYERFHGGGKATSERLAMLEENETVITAEQRSQIRDRLQQGDRRKATDQGTGRKEVSIMNVTDPRMVHEAIASDPDIIVNAISRRAPAIRRILGSGGS